LAISKKALNINEQARYRQFYPQTYPQIRDDTLSTNGTPLVMTNR